MTEAGETIAAAARRPFADRSGRGVRIAVIDSGVQAQHPHIRAAGIARGITILPDGSIEDGADATIDRLGHGTAVVAAIQEKAPDAQIVPIRVFRDALKTSAAALVAGIRWAAAQRVDIVNLSLGSTNAARADIFAAVVAEAAEAGLLLVAARDATGIPCYPGTLPGVIGISLDWDCPRDVYRAPADGSGFRASGHPRPIPGVPQRRNLYGISFSVATMSGFTALACEQAGGTGQDRFAIVGAALQAAAQA